MLFRFEMECIKVARDHWVNASPLQTGFIYFQIFLNSDLIKTGEVIKDRKEPIN